MSFTNPATGEQFEVDPDRPRTPVDSCGAALDAHTRFRAWLTTWLTTGPALDAIETVAKYRSPETGGAAGTLAVALQAFADTADTYYVSHDMSRLTGQLAEANGDHIPVLHATDIPSPFGLLIFGDPPRRRTGADIDRYEPHAHTRAFLWAVVPPGGHVAIPGWPTFEVAADPKAFSAAQAVDVGGVMMYELVDAGEYLVVKGAYEANGRPPMLPLHSSAIPFGVDVGWNHGDDYQIRQHMTRLFATVMRLMWQRVAPADAWTPPRSQARRWQRTHPRGRPAKVVHLRRYEPVEPSAAGQPAAPGRTLDHMVTVRGHWRDQWYRSLGVAYLAGARNEASHRRIWIDSHTRGEGDLVDLPAATVIAR